MGACCAPLFLVGALAAAVPIVLHLLKREPEARVKFAAVKLLRHAPVEHADRRHLRELLLLALRVAALLLLALAFARPFFGSRCAGRGRRGVTVVALDTSLSLSAPGQFDARARACARSVDRAAGGRPGRRSITFADAAEVAGEAHADRALALAAIDRAVPGRGRDALPRRPVRSRGTARRAHQAPIVVVTDLQENGWDAGDRVSLPESVNLEVADVGAPPPNLAVTALHVEGDRLVATVRNLGDAARDTTLTLSMHDTATPPASAAGREHQRGVGRPRRHRARHACARAPGALASVSVDDTSGAQADNARFLVLDDASRPAVLVVTATGDLAREAFYVQQALTVGWRAGELRSWRPQARRRAHSPATARLQPVVAVVS